MLYIDACLSCNVQLLNYYLALQEKIFSDFFYFTQNLGNINNLRKPKSRYGSLMTGILLNVV